LEQRSKEDTTCYWTLGNRIYASRQLSEKRIW
jgi:hypothetical protein